MDVLASLSDSKFFVGIMLLVLNLGSRHLVDEFSTNPEEYSRNLVLRRLAIFAVCFVGTRDIFVSIVLTAAFIIISTGISLKNREGMENGKKVDPIASKADQPAYDTQTPMLFTA
jgi:hypothetical protein